MQVLNSSVPKKKKKKTHRITRSPESECLARCTSHTRRIKCTGCVLQVMNRKISYCAELVDLLRDHLNDKHHTRLEWMIIILIMVEVRLLALCLFSDHSLQNLTPQPLPPAHTARVAAQHSTKNGKFFIICTVLCCCTMCGHPPW